ncbi:MAG: quinone-interacting membrane-bound oxidoreductase complex subunit QmoC [Nitrospinae bacterium]|nr:quinone-interacting membrane-bound oxidoreductase complex subunit QmoC [Nitrospinota bacterium]
MAEAYLVEPDLKFVQQLMDLGGGSLKKCYQCATCSVVCNSSPDARPFPRKEMIWAQWGLKDRLVKDPDVWLCHQCNDCSVRCPRGARPGDVLAAVRNYSFLHYAFPSFMGKAVSEVRYLPLLFALPILLLLALLSLTGNPAALGGAIVFEELIPHAYLDAGFITLGLLSLGSIAVGARRFWKDLLENSASHAAGCLGDGEKEAPRTDPGSEGFSRHLLSALSEILRHSKFKDCEANPIRYYAHLAIFYGFMGLFLTTTLVFLGIVLGGIRPPLAPFSAVKVLGNLSALAVFGGLTVVIYQRITQKEQIGRSSYYDWFFIGSLYAITITGILTEGARMARMAMMAYPLYAIHLIFVFVLLACLPYSKFAHLFYRSVAMVYAKYSGR